ncbi:MAG: hypothetical protein AAF641_06470 [Pseudomonadota bacterium]
MSITEIKALVAAAALTVAALTAATDTARAEPRWEGLLNDGNKVNWFELRREKKNQNTLESRGVQTNFDEAPMFEPEFQVETLRDKVRRPFTSLNRDR